MLNVGSGEGAKRFSWEVVLLQLGSRDVEAG
jgi:hypothetical protein